MKLADPVSLAETLRDFSRNPLAAGRELGDALRADSGAFLAFLLSRSTLDINDRGLRYALTLLQNNDVLIPAVASPGVTSFPDALRLTRCMLELDSNFINILLSAILMRELKDEDCILRVLDIVSDCASHLANWRSIARIHHEGDAQIRMKCASLLARFRFSDRAGLDRFREADPRVRANIIETLWGVGPGEADSLLSLALRDEDSRVAGNACLALYHAGDPRVLAQLADMLESSVLRHSVTAAWVIGQCRDGRFGGRLLKAMRKGIPALRRNAIASLAKLEPVPVPGPAASAPDSDEIDLTIVSAPQTEAETEAAPGGAQATAFELWLYACGHDGKFLRFIHPVDFFVRTGDEFVLDYAVDEVHREGEAAVMIVAPASNEDLMGAFRASVAIKPAAQSWAFAFYGGAGGASPAFESGAEALAALFDAGQAAGANAGEAIAALLRLDSAAGERHLIMFLDASVPAPEADSIRASCRQKGIRLHCWHLRKNTGEDTGSSDSGLTGLVRNGPESAVAWPRFVASLASRYVLRSQRKPTAVSVRRAVAGKTRFSGQGFVPKGAAGG